VTAIALAVHPRRAVLAADSIATDPISGAALGCVSKVAVAPHIRAVAAWCGLSSLGRAFTMLPPLPPGATVGDALGYMPAVLRLLFDEAARKQPPMPGAAMFVAGVTGYGEAASIAAFAMRAADDWAPLRLEAGRCYLLGEVGDRPPEPRAQEVIESDRATLAEPAGPIIPWLELSRMPFRIVELLRRERPYTVAGPTQSCLLTCESLFFTWDDAA
jgi:hypothetical protein